MEQSTRSGFRKAWRFTKMFVSAVVLIHIILFFVMNQAQVKYVHFIYTDITETTVRWVILVSMLAGALLMMILIWIYRLLTRRQ